MGRQRGRKKHSANMGKTSAVWSHHGKHRHVRIIIGIWERWAKDSRSKRNRTRPPLYTSVRDLMKGDR